MPAPIKGKHVLLRQLIAEEVRYIFGNPGTSEAAIMDALEDYPQLRYVLVVQEGVAIGMAEAYSRASGEVSFVSLHIDNGLANAFSLLIDSKRTGTPMVVTAGNKDVRKLAEDRSDLVEMARPFVKWSAEVTHPEQMASVMRRAFTEARTPPTGPVFVSFAGNALEDEAEVEIVASRSHFMAPVPESDAIEEAAEVLAAAELPVMVVGDRVARYDGAPAATNVAERLGARVYGHSSTEVNFPTGHSQWLGNLSLRQPAARQALRDADVVLVVGAPVFSDFFYQPGRVVRPDAKLIHIDINAEEIGKSEPTDIGIFATPHAALCQLDETLDAKMTGTQIEAARGRAETIAAETRQLAQAFEAAARQARESRPMGPAAMVYELARALPEDALVFDDSISTGGVLHAGVKFNEPGTLFGARGGAIGWGMGSALGLKLAIPDRPVVAVVGDGSAIMTVQALWTAVNSKIPVVYVICNNASYRILKVNMNVYKRLSGDNRASKYLGMDFPEPFDFAAIANALGVEGRRIENPEEIGPAMASALDSGAPALLDVIIDGSV